MRISDWSSDVCSSDLVVLPHVVGFGVAGRLRRRGFDGDRFAGRHRNRGRAGAQAGLLEEVATTRIDLFLFTHGPPSFSRGDLNRAGPFLGPAAHSVLRSPEIGRASWRERVCQYV